MESPFRHFRAWSVCDECGFEGLLGFDLREDEDYADPTALGVMVDATCPSCESVGAVLVALAHFEEMQAFERVRRREGDAADD